jgi:tetratricopeptide (TPR) repeat protein
MNTRAGSQKDKKEESAKHVGFAFFTPSTLLNGCLILLFFMVFMADGGRALFADTSSREARPSPRVITVKIAAEEVLGIRPAWKKDIKKLISISSETFKDKFGIEFRIIAWESWTPGKNLYSLQSVLEDLKRKVSPGEADIVVGVVAPSYENDPPAGFADYFHGSVLLKLVNPWDLAPIVLHELGHIFGAVDLDESGSVMNPHNPGLEFDRFSARIITLNRDRSFHASTFPFPRSLTNEVVAAFKARATLRLCEPELHLFLAYLYIESGDYASASAECLEILKFSPDSADVHVLLGNLKLAQGNVDEAIAEYRNILARQANLPTVHFNLGVAWSKRGNPEEAASSFMEAVRLRPDYAEAHANLAHLSLKKGDIDAAVRHCRTALRVFPDFVEGLCILSVALILEEKENSLQEAVELSRKAVTLRPHLAEAHAILGIGYGNLGRNSEAEGELLKAVQLRPDSLEAHLSLALLFKKTGRNGEAAFHLARIAEIDSGFMERHQVQSSNDIIKLRSADLLARVK